MNRLHPDRIGRLGRVAALAVIVAVVLSFGLIPSLGQDTANGVLLGATPAGDPVALLGTRLGDTGCPSAPLAIGEGRTVVCPEWTAVTLPDGLVQVVSLYGPGNGSIDTFRGELPQGLHWGDGVNEIVATLGQPQRLSSAFQTPTLVYMFRGLRYGSLELRLSLGGRLQRINACLKR
jgi:hypothetical protein